MQWLSQKILATRKDPKCHGMFLGASQMGVHGTHKVTCPVPDIGSSINGGTTKMDGL